MRWVLLLSLVACGIPGHGPGMEPGNDCMSCHAAGERAQPWTVAGSLYADSASDADAGVEGAKVIVTDDAGRVLTLLTNYAGNFYTAEPLRFPIHVQAEYGGTRMAMAGVPTTGSCNSCHTVPAQSDAPGRLFVPK